VDSKKNYKKLLITKDQMALLKNSKELQNTEIYGNMFNAINSYDSISEQDLLNDIRFDSKAKAAIKNNVPDIIKEVIQEWSGIGNSEVSDGKVHCQLCGTQNTYVFYIKNKYTGIEMNVGSSCINKFPDIENVKQIKRNIQEENKRIKEQSRLIEFEAADEDYIFFVSQAEEKFKKLDILLPSKMDGKVKGILYNLNAIKRDYVSSGGDLSDVINRIKILKLDFNREWVLVQKFYEKNKNNPLACPKYVADWLSNKNKPLLVEIRKNDGKFDYNTIQSIYNGRFIDENLELFKSKLDSNITKLHRRNGNKLVFSIKNNDYTYPVYYMVSTKTFMEFIGCQCFFIKGYKYNSVDFMTLEIIDSEENFRAIYNRIQGLLLNIGYDIDIEENTLYKYIKRLPMKVSSGKKWGKIERRKEIAYRRISNDKIFEMMSQLLYYDDSTIKNKFKRYFDSIENNWISEHEKKRYAEIAGEAASLQKQKEFIPY
jgi:hypothetical protein